MPPPRLQFLPTPEERDWLIARLAELIARRGETHFLDMPLVLLTPDFFPDPWSFSHEGVDRLTRRLMQYAGLHDLDVRIQTYVEDDPGPSPPGLRRSRSTAGFFMGIEQGCCLFGFNEEAPEDAGYMAGVMGHEVAHAYRVYHGVPEADSVEEEECLTDLTASYLGFGILATNNSLRYRTAGRTEGYLTYTSWSFHTTGYLTPQAFAFLFALQMMARNTSTREEQRLLKHLETNQAAFTKAALDAVWAEEADIMEALRLNRDEERPAPRLPDEVLRPLPPYDPSHRGDVEGPGDEPPRINEGRPVFRVHKTYAQNYGMLGLVAGTMLGAVIGSPDDPLPGRGMIGVVIGAVIGAVVGLTGGVVIGRRTSFDVCSDPACRSVLREESICPRCRGLVAGRIRHPDERLEAAVRWERERRKGRGKRGKSSGVSGV
jgi:hypothetical protein